MDTICSLRFLPTTDLALVDSVGRMMSSSRGRINNKVYLLLGFIGSFIDGRPPCGAFWCGSMGARAADLRLPISGSVNPYEEGKVSRLKPNSKVHTESSYKRELEHLLAVQYDSMTFHEFPPDIPAKPSFCRQRRLQTKI